MNNKVDKDAAKKVIGILGALWMASSDEKVRAAAHFAANALREASEITSTETLSDIYPNHFN
ncbi:TPA: hypothetical protein HLT81_24795 [Escherichia coli]|nr:hypothetical protein [Escherichia coli]